MSSGGAENEPSGFTVVVVIRLEEPSEKVTVTTCPDSTSVVVPEIVTALASLVFIIPSPATGLLISIEAVVLMVSSSVVVSVFVSGPKEEVATTS